MAAPGYFVLLLGFLIKTVETDYCIADFASSQHESQDACTFPMKPNKLSAQCYPHDLTTVLPMETQFDHQIVWIEKGDMCTHNFCPALVRNISDPIAVTSIQCISCSESHIVLCDHIGDCSGADTIVSLVPTDHHQGSCQNSWTRHHHKEYLISPVRRTLLESIDWCTSMNASHFNNNCELNFLENMTLPDPVMTHYWITVSFHGANQGRVLTTSKSDGTLFTKTYNIIHNGVDPNMLFGCICVRKDKEISTTTQTTPQTTTAQTTTPIAATQTTVTQTTTSATTTTTTQSTTPTTKQSSSPGYTTGRYKHIAAMDGVMDQSDMGSVFRVGRSLECAMSCDQRSNCQSYFFDKSSSSCQLNTKKYTSKAAPLLSSASAKYFERD